MSSSGASKDVHKGVQGASVEAYMIYRTLPSKKLDFVDIIGFCKGSVRSYDVIWLAILSVFTALIGILPQTISQRLYDDYIPLSAKAILFQLCCVMASFMLANVIFSILKNIINFRISGRVSFDTQSAMYDRLFNLSESFFRRFESADLVCCPVQK